MDKNEQITNIKRYLLEQWKCTNISAMTPLVNQDGKILSLDDNNFFHRYTKQNYKKLTDMPYIAINDRKQFVIYKNSKININVKDFDIFYISYFVNMEHISDCDLDTFMTMCSDVYYSINVKQIGKDWWNIPMLSNYPLSKTGNRVYYFDNNGIFTYDLIGDFSKKFEIQQKQLTEKIIQTDIKYKLGSIIPDIPAFIYILKRFQVGKNWNCLMKLGGIFREERGIYAPLVKESNYNWNKVSFKCYIPVRVAYGKISFFDYDKRFHILDYEDYHNLDTFNIKDSYRNMSRNLSAWWSDVPNLNIFANAVSNMKEGDTWEHFIEECIRRTKIAYDNEFKSYTTKEEKYAKEGGAISEFMMKPKIRIEREVGNKDTKTFDFIRAEFYLIPEHRLGMSRRNWILKNKHDIFKYVLRVISENKNFQKYGVPVNILKVSDIRIAKTGDVEILFVLKESKK